MAKRSHSKGAAPTTKPAVKYPGRPAREPERAGYTQEEVANKVGCSQSSVSRAVARGDIVPLANGLLSESAIDTMREVRKLDAAASEVTSELERKLLAAQVSERETKAQYAKLKLDLESGRYVEREAVERSGADAAARILGVLRAIPQRVALALECACRSGSVVEAKVSAEIERAVAELHNSVYFEVTP